MTFDPVSSTLVFLGLWMVAVTNLRTSIVLLCLQTTLLASHACFRGVEVGEGTLILAGASYLAFKGIGVPTYLIYVTRRLGSPREDGLHLSPPLLLFLAVGSLAALLLLQPFREVVPATSMPAFALLFVGMLLMLSRRLAISQIIGFLVLENSMFLYTISQHHGMPLVVELGALFELLVWTLMAGVLAFHIKDRFEHIDVSVLRELRG